MTDVSEEAVQIASRMGADGEKFRAFLAKLQKPVVPAQTQASENVPPSVTPTEVPKVAASNVVSASEGAKVVETANNKPSAEKRALPQNDTVSPTKGYTRDLNEKPDDLSVDIGTRMRSQQYTRLRGVPEQVARLDLSGTQFMGMTLPDGAGIVGAAAVGFNANYRGIGAKAVAYFGGLPRGYSAGAEVSTQYNALKNEVSAPTVKAYVNKAMDFTLNGRDMTAYAGVTASHALTRGQNDVVFSGRVEDRTGYQLADGVNVKPYLRADVHSTGTNKGIVEVAAGAQARWDINDRLSLRVNWEQAQKFDPSAPQGHTSRQSVSVGGKFDF